ncbi:GNAT family N-acetyltransferase [Streptomyces sp. NPDC052114]|uniref:GNAT family N-acetyltransferase n=1 Tax=unclassified Streptomyces TaxID=2593676 RepID=UPI0034470ED1
MSGYEIRPMAGEDDLNAALVHMRRSFGKAPYEPETLLREGHGKVATKGGEIVGGGLVFAFDQYFGGRAVPSGGTAWLAVAPWARGERLGRRIMQSKLAWLKEECGAAVTSGWSPATGMYRSWGWEVGAIGSTFTVRPSEIPVADRSYEPVLPGPEECRALHERLAPRWDGPLRRPDWWAGWKQRCTPSLHTLGMRKDGELVAYATFTEEPVQPWGFRVVVHDFWADHAEHVPAALDLLSTRALQVREIEFRRSVLSRAPYAAWELPQYTLVEQGRYPVIFKILDVRRALEARGWSTAVEASVCLEVRFTDDSVRAYTLDFSGGSVSVKSGGTPTVRCTEGSLASWYAGAMSMRRGRDFGRAWGQDREIDLLDAAIVPREAWIPDTF